MSRSEVRLSGFAVGVVVGVVVSVAASAAELRALVPDATQAQIDGRIAVGLWPTENGEILGPEGFTVHLADDSVLEEELTFRSGYWFQPPPGRYKVWIEGRAEGGARIQPTFTLLTFKDQPFEGRGMAAKAEVGPAGAVRLDPKYSLTEEQSLRLLYVDTARQDDDPLTRGFLRSVTAERAREEVLMPTGEVVGLIYDRKRHRYLAASRPAKVEPGGTTAVVPLARRGVSDLLAIVRRVETVDRVADDDLKLIFHDGAGRRRPPDVVVPTWEWVYALWYDVDGRTARVEASSSKGWLDEEVVLMSGGVATLRGELKPRPHLDVRLELPAELRAEGAVVEIERHDDGQRLARRELPLDAQAVTRFLGLPPTGLRVVLRVESTPIWKLRERVDLSDGGSRELLLRFSPIHLSGTVYHGSEPSTGRLKLYTLNEPGMTDSDMARGFLEVEIDDDGNYSAVVLKPGKFLMTVDLEGVPGPEFPVRHMPFIAEDTVFDVRIPRAGGRVAVRDARTGSPIDDALVIAHNVYELNGEDPPRRAAGSNVARSGDDGWAELPPLYPGPLKVKASKDGYLDSEMIDATVVDGDIVELAIDLEPVEVGAVLQLTLPDGRPAAGAEARLQGSVWNDRALWQGRTGPTGQVGVPRGARGSWLLVRHPEAGSWIERWETDGDEMVSWTLPPRAEDLTLRLVGLDGRRVSFASVAMRFPRTWVAGGTLAWLTDTLVAGGGADGLWTARNLPATGALQVVAGSPETMELALRGALDGQARRLSPPWPEQPVEVTADRRR